MAIKMWAYSPKIANMAIICKKNCLKGYIPLWYYYKIWRGEAVVGPSAPSRHCGLKGVGPPNRKKMLILGGINLHLGVDRKNWTHVHNYKIPLCNGTIKLFWKLHCFIAFPLSQTSSFQSLTNEQKQTNKHHTFSSSIVTMAVSVAVCGIFSVKECCDLYNSAQFV